MVGDSSTRTVPIKLDVDESAANLLHQTTDHFLDAANYVVDVAWKPTGKSPANRNSTTKRTTMFETNHRSRPTSCKPATRAAEAVKGCVERWKKARKPRNHTSRHGSPATTRRTGTVNDDHATLATIDGRVTADFILPDERRDTPHSAYLFNDDYDVNGATLHYDEVEDCFYLHVRTKPAVENDEAEQGDANTSPSLVLTSESQTSQPPQPDASGVAANSTTGIESTRSAGATSNKPGLDGHTRMFSGSVASKLGASSSFFTRSRTNL